MNLCSPAGVAALLKRYAHHPRRRFGQNFLIDGNTLNNIVQAGQLSSGDQVIEIGAGLGVLTQALAEAVGTEGQVVALETDRDLIPILNETVGGYPQAKIIFADALSLPWPSFIDELAGAKPLKVIANIPYNITTPLLTTLLPLKERLALIVFLVQKEVAQRLTALPNTSDYGALSVFAQYHAKPEIVGIVSRRVFLPAPNVDSAIVRLILHASAPVAAPDEARFFAVVRASFGQRRKTLINSLSGDPALGWSREEAAGALGRAAIDPQRRGESLSLEEFARLAS